MKIRIILILSVLGLAVLALWQIEKASQPRLVYCDVGQGDGVVFNWGTFQFVYDAGPKNGKMVDCLQRYVPFWDRQLEVMVISHQDNDHSGGLEQIQRSFKIKKLLGEELEGGEVLKNNKFRFEVLSASGKDDNEGSVVGLLEVNGKKVLLMGDAGVEVEQRLVWRKELTERVEVLKVSHHGSNTGTSRELLETVRPRVAVIGVGKNSFGHPSEEVLERLGEYGVEIRRTDRDGDIVFLVK